MRQRVASRRGYPFEILVDNGPEFTGKALDVWAYGHGVKLNFIRPGTHRERGATSCVPYGLVREAWATGDQHLGLLLDVRVVLAKGRPVLGPPA